MTSESFERTVQQSFDLAMRYHNGCGVVKDYKESLKYLHIAGESGHIEAQYYLGECYNKGHGTQQNLQLAIKWYEKAAIQGNAEAQFILGNCHIEGVGVVKDTKKGKYPFTAL